MDILLRSLAVLALLCIVLFFAHAEDWGRANFFLLLAVWGHLDLMLKRLREGDDT